MDDVNEEAVEWCKEAWRLIPAWFIERMTSDVWSFGLLLETGHTLCIERIVALRQGADGSIWIDVEMLTDLPFLRDGVMRLKPLITSPTSRARASVQASKVVAAFELADT
jgi:hypothetical protein